MKGEVDRFWRGLLGFWTNDFKLPRTRGELLRDKYERMGIDVWHERELIDSKKSSLSASQRREIIYLTSE